MSSPRTMNPFLESYDTHEKALAAKGFDVVAHHGLAGWLGCMKDAGQDINRSFNPDVQPQINASNSLWFECRSQQSGELAAFNALRVYDGADLRVIAETGCLWWSAAEALANRYECLLPADFPTIRGKLFQLGGLFTVPAYRRHSIGYHLTRMGRAAGFSVFQCSDNFGLEKSAIATTGKMPLEYFGYARCEILASGVAVGATLEDFYLTHISHDEALERLADDANNLSLMDSADNQVLDKAI